MSVAYPIQLGVFPLYRGDSADRNGVHIVLTDSTGAAVDLTLLGSAWTAQARATRTSVDAVDLVIDASAAASGVLDVSLAQADSVDLPDSLVFDVQVTGGPVDPLTVFAGRFTVDGDVTR